MPKPSDAILRDYQLGRLSPTAMAAVERWLEETPGAADELGRVAARDRVTDALIDTNALDTPLAPAHGLATVAIDVPVRLGGFTTVRELGRGGMGIVLEAQDTWLNRRVAVKIVGPRFAADAIVRERFLREAQAVAKIDHPNVVPVFQVGECGGVPYLVMPLLEGETLDARLKREKKLTVAEVMRIGREVAAGLAAAHAVGLIHRDIKPANIWLDAGTGRARVLDFGLAKPLDRADALTRAGAVMGTPHYMAPEQAAGRPTDGRTDLWSLGVVLYQMATGKRPFTGETAFAVIAAVATHTPAAPDALNPHLPPDLTRLITALLAKAADARPQSAEEVAAALSRPPVPAGAPRPSSPWDEIDVDDETEVDAPEAVRSKPVGARGRRMRVAALACAAGAALAVLLAGIVIVVRDKQGREVARVTVPDGGSVEIKPVPVAPPKIAPTDADIDRTAAAAVLAGGGSVVLDGTWSYNAAPLPDKPFKLTGVYWRTATDADLAKLRGCKSIAELDVLESQVTDAGLAHLKGLTNLTTLITQGTHTTDAGHANFKGSTDLRALNIRSLFGRPKLTDAGVENYRDCTKLVTLALAYNAITDKGLGYFAGCAELERLQLNGCERLTDRALGGLTNHPRLWDLVLLNVPITDAGADKLKACTNLTDLNLIGTKVTEAKVEELARALPRCQILWGERVFEPTSPDRRAAHWVLAAGGTVRVNGAGRAVTAVADLPADDFRLTHVDLSRRGLAERLPPAFQNCKHVTHLDLSHTAATDADLKHFRNCSGLTVLLLERCANVTDAALPPLKDYQKLSKLVLLAVPVTDAGVEHLKGCKSLRELWVNTPKVTEGKVQGLIKALPKCRIVSAGTIHEPTEKD